MKYYILNEKQMKRIIELELEMECLEMYNQDYVEDHEEFIDALKEEINVGNLDSYEDEEEIVNLVIEERLKDYEEVDFNG